MKNGSHFSGVAPFSGATTGTGGRIRDIQSAGRGGHVIAGTAGYCFGNLNIPGKIPGKMDGRGSPVLINTLRMLKIMDLNMAHCPQR